MITGRDLILYILKNGLENTPAITDGCFTFLMSDVEASIVYGVGTGTIRAWYEIGALQGTKIGDSIFVLRHQVDPRERTV